MKFSLTVDSPREAGYAMSMFSALRGAMLAEPPPGVASTTETYAVDGVSHSVLTQYAATNHDPLNNIIPALHPVGSSEADAANAADEIAQEAAKAVAGGADPAAALAAATTAAAGKKRGRKSEADKAAEAAAKAAAAENALRPGDALKGVSAQSLAAALSGMPLVHESEGLQVRVAPGTPAEEIDAMRARIEAQDVTQKSVATTAPAAETAQPANEPVSNVVPGPGANMDDDLASLFRKKEAEPPASTQQLGASRFAGMTGPQLLKEFMGYINGDGGLFWARNVLKAHNLEVLDDLTEAQIRDALENPGQFKPAT